MKKYIVTDEELKSIFKAGFFGSSEGMNGEYPLKIRNLFECYHYNDSRLSFQMIFEDAIRDLEEIK